MKHYPVYLFDLDGTIYRGRELVPYAGSVVTELLRRGSKTLFFTNNSAARPSQVSAMLNHLGVPCKAEWVFGTGQLALAKLLEKKYSETFVVGEEALKTTLLEGGVNLGEEAPDAVVVGICRSLTYDLLDQASSIVRKGAAFFATNEDATYPLEKGRLQPGAGAIVASIRVASGRSPIVLGKPEPLLAELAMRSVGAVPSEVLVVGDRMDTDIECGKRSGCDTFLVLTGVESVVPPSQAGGPDLRSLI